MKAFEEWQINKKEHPSIKTSSERLNGRREGWQGALERMKSKVKRKVHANQLVSRSFIIKEIIEPELSDD